MNLQEFKNEMQSVYKTGRDFTEEVISLVLHYVLKYQIPNLHR